MAIILPLEPQEEARLVALSQEKGVTADTLVREAIRQDSCRCSRGTPEGANALSSRTAREIRSRALGRGDRSEPGGNVRQFPAHRFLMLAAIADTHTAMWYLFSDPRLGKAASVFIDDTIAKSGAQNGGLNPRYQIGGPRSVQLALKLLL